MLNVVLCVTVSEKWTTSDSNRTIRQKKVHAILQYIQV